MRDLIRARARGVVLQASRRGSGAPQNPSAGDASRGRRRAAPPDQPLELVDVDRRDREEGRLAQLLPERYQPLGPPAQDSEIVVEAAPLALEGVELVHDSAASVGAVGAHRSREDGAGRFGEVGAGDLELNLTPSCADPCCVAISDLQLPAGELEQLEQERASMSVGGQVRCHATKASRSGLCETYVAPQSSRGRMRCSLRSWTNPRT